MWSLSSLATKQWYPNLFHENVVIIQLCALCTTNLFTHKLHPPIHNTFHLCMNSTGKQSIYSQLCNTTHHYRSILLQQCGTKICTPGLALESASAPGLPLAGIYAWHARKFDENATNYGAWCMKMLKFKRLAYVNANKQSLGIYCHWYTNAKICST